VTRQLLAKPKTRASLPVQTSLLQRYLNEISQYPLMSPEEEYQFAKQHYEEGDVKSAHRLITSNLRLVVKIANNLRQAQLSLLDLIQEGNYGLMKAIKRFNPYKGVKLSSYAAWWIRAYILKYIMDNKNMVKIATTATQRKLYYNLRKESEKLLMEFDHIDPKIIAKNLNVKEKEVIEMQQRLNSSDISMDSPVKTDQTLRTQADLIASPVESADILLERAELNKNFHENLLEFHKTLFGRDLEIFEKRLLNEKPITLREIGNTYCITRERVRQIEGRIIFNLKKFIKEKGTLSIEN